MHRPFLILTFLAVTFSLHQLPAQDRAFLGIKSNHVSKKKANALSFENPYGNYITRVAQNSAAAEMGLQPFDYVYEVAGQPLSDERDLHDALSEFQPGQQIAVGFIRSGQVQKAIGTLTDHDAINYEHRPDEEDPFLGVEYRYQKNKPILAGTPVRVVPCSTAEALGMQTNDIITRIDDQMIWDWHDVAAAIDNREVGDPIEVEYYRDGNYITDELPIKSLKESHEDPCDLEEEEPVAAVETPNEAVAQVQIDMEEVPKEDAEAMKREKGIDMPLVNDLRIEQLKLFPNPSNGIFNIQFDLPEQGRTSIRVFNSVGRLIYDYEVGRLPGAFQDRIDLTNRFKGIYFLEIRQGTLHYPKNYHPISIDSSCMATW